MTTLRHILGIITVVMVFFTLTSCSAEIGSDAWCKEMKDKPQGDWTMNEAGNYTKHCLFK